MNLTEAIEHCKDKISETKCGKEHKQLHDWLVKLQKLEKAVSFTIFTLELYLPGGIYQSITGAADGELSDCLEILKEAMDNERVSFNP